ncbi:hypothetical protein KIN20_035155 [Parelaphostrongylus tenuis]|uniref:Uncharacterized protein n=1 Tax=Parelaphostrongylus tenuis TaxID=148309 RepID=A0AAD5RAP8_PARTN|nr:hypothetical protein KIN20_035155 [Parelaphostrongylus tenuis]
MSLHVTRSDYLWNSEIICLRRFNDNGMKAVLENLIDVLIRLKAIESQMLKMRKECQDRQKIWEIVEREVNDLEEKAVLYRYRVVETQSLHNGDERKA